MNDTRYTSVLAGTFSRNALRWPRCCGWRQSAAGNLCIQWRGHGDAAQFMGAGGDLARNRAGRAWRVPGKPRTDHRHHAIDAITIALTRSRVIQSMAHAASMEPWQIDARAWRKIESPWRNFVPSIRPHIEQMLVSHRPEHKMSGELHKGTNYSDAS